MPEQSVEELAGAERRLADRDGVEIGGLVAEPFPFGLRFDG